ncbi:hypothetical protein P7K49_005521 [Saguinus oedipus]|uniref:Uncharacterized protein n=1 Tax=Saguinus oedipus TaxID=9490 RepID=A0ABQ9VZT6_SAGOE|nr:hypothetical protein P7K49_005521 [Saguinus oedipus]
MASGVRHEEKPWVKAGCGEENSSLFCKCIQMCIIHRYSQVYDEPSGNETSVSYQASQDTEDSEQESVQNTSCFL